ncbi:EpsG family protein [Pedobacter agri]|uniref:EpsG family protein n=1 Tax=Pedobacter agri TaxID=454586 RepID=UPI002788C756|nr:EpsG family protein [Pedobacter agri]MDQ1141129.1 hypothetical protein [Pedobacter agri]
MYSLIFLSSVIFALLSQFKSEQSIKIILCLIIGFILIISAGTRSSDVGKDYEEYIRLFDLFPNFKGVDASTFLLYEPATILIPNIFLLIAGPHYYLNLTFILFAFLGVSIKLYAIQKYRLFFLGIVVYVSSIYFLQEMVIIRAGVACALFLLSINDLVEGNNKKYFLKITIALLFHFSSFIFILVWIFIKFKIKPKVLYAILFLCFAIALLKINLLTLLRIDSIFPKVRLYLDLLEITKEGPVNIFNFKIIFSLFFTVLFAFKASIFKGDKLFDVLFPIHIMSISLFFVLSPTAMVFSLRVFDLLSVVQILLYPFLIYIFKERWIGYLIILTIAVFNFIYTFYLTDIFNYSYNSWII